MRGPLLSIAFAVLAGGCGGDDPGPEALTPGEADTLCSKSCSYDTECEGADLDSCVDECATDLGTWTRHDAISTIASCREGLACEEDTDVCLARVKPLAYHKAFESRCRASLAECPIIVVDADCSVEYNEDGEDIGYYRFMTRAVIDELSACLDAATCDARLECFEGVYAAHGINL